MPLTIITQPSPGVDQILPTPVYDFIIGEVSSSNVDIVRLRVKATVYAGDDLGSGVIGEPTMYVDPNPDASNEFKFDLQALVRDFVKGYTYSGDDLPTRDAATAWYNRFNSARIYEIDMTEIVENTAGLLVDGDGDVMNPAEAVNTDTDMVSFTMSGGDTGRFLTNHPRSENITIRRDENCYISGLLAYDIDSTGTAFDDPGIYYNLFVTRYDIDGAVISTEVVLLGDGSTKSRRFDIGVGPNNLNAFAAGLISEDVISYSIRMSIATDPAPDAQQTVISETLTFKINDDCVDDRNLKRIIWVNDLSGLDFYTFTGEMTRDVQVDKETFDEVVRDDSTEENRGKKTLRTIRQHTSTAHSDLLSESKRRWLQELFDDVLTWEETSSTGYRSLSIITTKQSVVNRTEGTYQMFVEVTEAFPKNRQHG